jgi:hypothetical protein
VLFIMMLLELLVKGKPMGALRRLVPTNELWCTLSLEMWAGDVFCDFLLLCWLIVGWH